MSSTVVPAATAAWVEAGTAARETAMFNDEALDGETLDQGPRRQSVPDVRQISAVYQNIELSVGSMFVRQQASAAVKVDSVLSALMTLRASDNMDMEVDEYKSLRSAMADLSVEQKGSMFPFVVPKSDPIVFDPRSSVYRTWEIVFVPLLLFTAFVTPFEVAAVDMGIDSTDQGLFWINRIVDLGFFLDILINLKLAFFNRNAAGMLEVDARVIRNRYLNSWFTVDMIAVLPYELLHGDVQHLKLLRLLRLLKLSNMRRINSLTDYWQRTMGIQYSTINLLWNIVMLVVLVHWMACLWFLVMDFEASGETMWISSANPDWTIDNVPLFQGYIASLYHASMTVTTIGYGDIVAMNTAERWVSTLILQMFGAWVFAYVIAICTAIIASMNRKEFAFNCTVDNISDMAEDSLLNISIPDELQYEMREFLLYSRSTERTMGWQELVRDMSLSLQVETNHALVDLIQLCPYFSGLGIGFKNQLALRLVPEAYRNGEMVLTAGPVDRMLFLVSGRVVRYGKEHVAPAMFAHEAIAECGTERIPVRAVTNVKVMWLSRKDIREVTAKFPHSTKVLRKQVLRLSFKRGILKAIDVIRMRSRTDARNAKQLLLKNAKKLRVANLLMTAGGTKTISNKLPVTGVNRQEVETWEEGLNADDLALIIEKQTELLQLDTEVKLAMTNMCRIQEEINTTYSKLVKGFRRDGLLQVSQRVGRLASQEHVKEIIDRQETFWESRQDLDLMVS